DGKQFSTGITGEEGTFNAMSLQNLLWDTRFFWDGRSSSLEEQALLPIEDPIELHQSLEATVEKFSADTEYPTMFEEVFGDPAITADRIAKAIGQFERILISNDSRFDQYLRNEGELTELELLGYRLFSTHPNPRSGTRGANCADCHLGPRTSGSNVGFQGFHNNGLDGANAMLPGLAPVSDDPGDFGKFKAPTLRNIAKTAPYMHDGRFQTLEEVLDHYNEHIQYSETLDILITEASNNVERIPGEVKLGLTEEEKTAILAFLETLTDEQFLSNPAFSDPFE
ncbi:MAG: cytochrome c peroxidase, partial [Bacteroidota bacterium]